MSTGRSDSRTVVKAYVPEYVKAEWETHAEEVGAESLSEYVQMMVDAGRRQLDPQEADPRKAGNTGSEDAHPGGSGYKDRILRVLREESHLDWDELVDRLTEDLEEDLDEALSELQDENRVRYAGRHGGYEVTDR